MGGNYSYSPLFFLFRGEKGGPNPNVIPIGRCTNGEKGAETVINGRNTHPSRNYNINPQQATTSSPPAPGPVLHITVINLRFILPKVAENNSD